MAQKRIKHKEMYKNILLLLLIPLSVVLFFRLWFGSWFWSYNMDFSNNTFFGLFEKSADIKPAPADEIVMPKRLIVSGGGKRAILEKGTNGFSSCYADVLALSDSLKSAEKPTIVPEEEFVSGLKTRSVFFDFGNAYGRELLSLMNFNIPVSALQNMLITPGDSVIQKTHIYFKDYTTNEVYRLISDVSSNKINELIDKYVSLGNMGNVPFAFELGFDKTKSLENSEITQNILLDSYLTIGLTGENVEEIYVRTPDIFAKTTDTPSSADAITSLFGFSSSTTRRYVENDDITTFVNKNGTLKIYKTGYLEYTAENGGIEITDRNNSSAETALGNIYSLVQNILKAFDLGETQLHISSDLYGIEKPDFNAVINIDCLVNGNPVTIISDGLTVHPISIVIENGKIVSYKHYIYRFEPSGNYVSTSSMIKAVDLLYANFSKLTTEVLVSDIYKSYVYTVGGGSEVLWCAKVAGEDNVNIIRE